MSFSWGEALRVALVGFSGVFVILTILWLSLKITAAVVRRLPQKPPVEKKRSA